MNRRGFTLIELMVAATLMGLVGVIMARLLISDSRFVGRQDAMMDARQASRAALNTMSAELRMVSDSGLVAATSKSVTVRVPYAFGMACEVSGSALIAALLPPDSLTYANAVPYGIAWRSTSNTYDKFVTGISVATSASTASCTVDSIRVVPKGKLVAISGLPASSRPNAGTIFYLYQKIVYSFSASTTLSGRQGLWRQALPNPADEIVTPFDTSAGFGFLTGTALTISNSPPADLTTVRGLQLRLVGASQYAPVGSATFQKFDMRPKILFLNRKSP